MLDKHREVSSQKAVYRLLGLQMSKSSIKVKYLSTSHPHHRDGLLKGNIAELEENESVFHLSHQQYYEARPLYSINVEDIIYSQEELQNSYWDNMCLAEFWSKYEIVYGNSGSPKFGKKTSIIPLDSKKGFIRRRSEMAVLKYYLNYTNDEDLARGLLVLFLPFRDEMREIHQKDVKEVLEESRHLIEEKRSIFEKYKVMTEIIASIKSSEIKDDNEIEQNEEESGEIETTSTINIDEFNRWARSIAMKDLSHFKNLTDVCDIKDLRLRISSLNGQQRKLFDDVVERIASFDTDERPFYLFLTGNAGTGKTFLMRQVIDAVKVINVKAGIN